MSGAANHLLMLLQQKASEAPARPRSPHPDVVWETVVSLLREVGQLKANAKTVSTGLLAVDSDLTLWCKRVFELKTDVDENSYPERNEPSPANKNKAKRVLRRFYNGNCPCCLKREIVSVGLAPARYKGNWDHWVSRSENRLTSGWLVCAECNFKLGPANSQQRRDPVIQSRFDTFQKKLLELDSDQMVLL